MIILIFSLSSSIHSDASSEFLTLVISVDCIELKSNSEIVSILCSSSNIDKYEPGMQLDPDFDLREQKIAISRGGSVQTLFSYFQMLKRTLLSVLVNILSSFCV